MIRPREYSTKDILSALPKEVRAEFLELEPAERKLLMNGSEAEKEQYGWLPPGAAKRFAKMSEPERKMEANAGWRARRAPRPPTAAPVVSPVPMAAKPAVKPGLEVEQLDAAAVELCETSARVAETARDIFELPKDSFERVQSMAVNYLQTGNDEAQTLDRVAALLIDEVPLPASEPAPTKVQVMFARGGVRI